MILGWKEYALMGLFVAVLLAGWKIYHAGGVNAVAKAEKNATEHSIAIKEKQDEIKNNRPDDAAIVIRLRSHTF